MLVRVALAALLVGLVSAPLHAEQDPPRIKRKAETPASDFSLPRVPFADYSAELMADPAIKNRSAVAPSGIDTLNAHKQAPAPFLGLQLKRSLN